MDLCCSFFCGLLSISSHIPAYFCTFVGMQSRQTEGTERLNTADQFTTLPIGNGVFRLKYQDPTSRLCFGETPRKNPGLNIGSTAELTIFG